ncbi:TPA: 3-hydroxyacyl-CoA dehydrogenase NAD-binding domain-containing protein [Legionella pneumophila]|uniref:3-hydroxyacyl-CoA dehydrogenase NAD-binding domain-containing protein n=1 Tax=Legionella pneumophila TaxID=446 RepID=A0A378K6E5_LEGPN|nr:3-hydroxyacyl-CoA dehydrogenase NAD-binding domain-containing protein [Legionella pneumophila]ABQ55366.1 3-hydroxyacyl CoA dehydrogenase [Legionella pneumophila str. Corby]ADG25297.1 3-hydroxybutyryl-CoA dehydrogenase [Legionella pneumophila 2300/99 Alcoy]ANH13284.1 3-hydroxybutyryl-CoA dehydrogenase [Legionella pneumophila]ANH16250.1 3-hydroxybutyryl-CoA dehydrogenase [Legionella pneumophila]ANH19217.1 3-hydroxybutyryl-CoA dehydrogenase [Legionella pneumophila]
MKQTKLTLLGAGTMGSGITQLFAQYGFYVTLIDNLQSQLDKAKDTIAKNLHYLALTQNLESTHSIETILASITFTTKLDELKQSEYIIENITENWERKKALYQVLKKECSATCILGVNTSSIPITKIASLVDHPQRVIGVHFMNPAPMMPMVEVIKGYHTDELTIEKTRTLLEQVHKKMIVVKDSVGFVSNRAMMIFINEAIFMVQENIASIEDIDVLFKQCFGHKMGPLHTADLIGLDTVLYSLETIYSELNDPKYRPCWLLRNMVDAGLLGQKTKKGFYQYE